MGKIKYVKKIIIASQKIGENNYGIVAILRRTFPLSCLLFSHSRELADLDWPAGSSRSGIRRASSAVAAAAASAGVILFALQARASLYVYVLASKRCKWL